ncbi:thiamine-binding protein [Salinarchaeum chitinilyticum]
MTVVAFLSVAPVKEGSMAADAVDALEAFDVEYQTTPMGTVIETADVGELLDAVEAAHTAVDADRVSTFLKIDDKRTSSKSAAEKVERVEQELGRAAQSTK